MLALVVAFGRSSAIIRKISSTGAASITERLIPTRGAPPKSLARSLSRS